MKCSLIRILSVGMLFSLASVAQSTESEPLWMWCKGTNDRGETTHLDYSNMFTGSISLSGPEFIEEVIKWDGSADLDPQRYDIINFGAMYFKCKTAYSDGVLDQVDCNPSGHKFRGITANYMEGINPRIIIDYKAYGSFSSTLSRVPNSTNYVLEMTLSKKDGQKFRHTQTINNLNCKRPARP